MRHTIAMRGWMFFSVIGLLAALLSVSCWPTEAYAGFKHSVPSSRPGTHKSKSLGAYNGGSAGAWTPSTPEKRSPGSRNAGQSGYGTYNPESIRRFWSHYHGARTEKKSKPLEREQ